VQCRSLVPTMQPRCCAGFIESSKLQGMTRAARNDEGRSSWRPDPSSIDCPNTQLFKTSPSWSR
jgi:hypothetical protein